MEAQIAENERHILIMRAERDALIEAKHKLEKEIDQALRKLRELREPKPYYLCVRCYNCKHWIRTQDEHDKNYEDRTYTCKYEEWA